MRDLKQVDIFVKVDFLISGRTIVFLNSVGKIPFFNDRLTMSQIIGATASRFSLRRCVGMGSSWHDLVADGFISLTTSSTVAGVNDDNSGGGVILSSSTICASWLIWSSFSLMAAILSTK